MAFVLPDEDETELPQMRLQIPPTDFLAFRTGSPPVRSTATGGASPSLEALAQWVHEALGHISWASALKIIKSGTTQVMGMEPDKVRELLSVRALRCEACELKAKFFAALL